MDCTEFLNRYSEYDDSLVPPAEADRFRRHMARCEGCARYDRVLRKGRMLVRQLPEVEPSDDFVPRLHARLRRESGGFPLVERGRLALPPLPSAAPREWADRRVDRDGRSSYSPLVTGPPTY